MSKADIGKVARFRVDELLDGEGILVKYSKEIQACLVKITKPIYHCFVPGDIITVWKDEIIDIK